MASLPLEVSQGILANPDQQRRLTCDPTPGSGDNFLTGTTWGKVVSADATDAAGHTPSDLPAWPRTP